MNTPELQGAYPLFNGERLDHLDPKGYPEFPNPVHFPPPPGSVDTVNGCGCLYTDWQQSFQRPDEPFRLETIWQPLWDTQKITGTHDNPVSEVRFFQGRVPGDTWADRHQTTKTNNFLRAGSLPYPKRFNLWEIEFDFVLNGRNYGPEYFGLMYGDGYGDKNAMVRVRIGEKDHLLVPFSQLYYRKWRQDDNQKDHYSPHNPRTQTSRFFTLPLPLYLPPIQNFCISLLWPNGFSANGEGFIRCALHGYLSREIP